MKIVMSGLYNQLNNINTIKTGPAYMNGYGDSKPTWSNPAPSSMIHYKSTYSVPPQMNTPHNQRIWNGTESTRSKITKLPYPWREFNYGD